MSDKLFNVTVSDWQKGINATNSRNLSSGGNVPDNSLNSWGDHNSAFKDRAFPYSDAVSSPWSLYMPNSDNLSNAQVSVHDDITNFTVPVNN